MTKQDSRLKCCIYFFVNFSVQGRVDGVICEYDQGTNVWVTNVLVTNALKQSI